jgi:predicted ribosomally synthesized peptide with SipW-like signal peptide
MMTKRRKVTRASLWTSAISLLLCVAMLAGATFAWFSDTVTSGKNQILAGNLDVELQYSHDMSSWDDVETTTEDLFLTDTLWEPGHAEVVYLKVINAGTLAIDWKLMAYAAAETKGTNMAGNSFSLSNYIKFAVVPVTAAYTTRDAAVNAAQADLTALGEYAEKQDVVKSLAESTYALIAYMPTTTGNEANYKTGTKAPHYRHCYSSGSNSGRV